MKKVSVIGGGFSGLAAACFLAKAGKKVTVFEKHSDNGGRARSFNAAGFTFDMGPSWYWMPDIFEDFFAHFGKTSADFYQLVQLDPGFQVIYGKDETLTIPGNLEGIYEIFESIEPGAANKLRMFLEDGAFKYRVGMKQLAYSPSLSWREYVKPDLLRGLIKLQVASPMSRQVRKYFKDPRLIGLMEFPVLFLGAMADKIPAMYNLMNYAALSLGTWYPMGGMVRIAEAMESLARSLGVEFCNGSEVSRLLVAPGGKAEKLLTSHGVEHTDGVVAACDYHHTEQVLLDREYRNYDAAYWKGRVMAPSCLIFYLGINKRLPRLQHHNLFFDAAMDRHARDIYEQPRWPEDPLFYLCCPSKTDSSVAPEGMENLFLLVPIAPGLPDNDEVRELYYGRIMKRIEQYCETEVTNHVVFKRGYCVKDFERDYHAFRGNAYGLANTLMQTAWWKPSVRNRKVSNLVYAGQLTVPGPGVPPALISGQIAAKELLKTLN